MTYLCSLRQADDGEPMLGDLVRTLRWTRGRAANMSKYQFDEDQTQPVSRTGEQRQKGVMLLCTFIAFMLGG